MSFVIAVFVYPGVLSLLTLGVGLLIDRVSGQWLPPPVIPVVGFSGLVGLGQLSTTLSVTAPLTGGAFVAAALAGYLSQRRRLVVMLGALRRQPWVAIATAAAYGIAIAPILFAGRPSLAFYLTDTTTGTHLAGADWLLNHGRHFEGLSASSSYGLQIRAYFDTNNYPSGGHVVLAGAGQLLPTRLIWLFQPYMAFALALIAPSAFLLLRRAGTFSAAAALGAVVTSVPALVYALDLTGSIKELTALPLIMALGVITSEHGRWLLGPPTRAIPIGLVVGGGLSAVGVPFAAWGLVATGVLLLVALVHHRKTRFAWGRTATLAGVGLVAAGLAAPAVVGNYSTSAASANGIATTTDPGNLLQPLDPLQSLGIWITGQYRLDPGEYIELTYGLIGITLICIPLGVAAYVRRREWVFLLWLALIGFLWWRLTLKGTTWTDGKLILLSSPLVVLVICAAPGGLWRQRQRALAALLGCLVTFGVLRSDAQQYHETNLAPTARFDELAAINERFAGEGPALALDFDEFVFYELRDLEISSPGFAYRSASVTTANVGYGQSVDIDGVPPTALAGQRLLVQRRGPASSRPPSTYALASRGTYYDVWKKEGDDQIIDRLGSSDALDAQSVQRCAEVERLAKTAIQRGGVLKVARRAPVTQVIAGRTSHSVAWGSGDTLTLSGAGRLDTTLQFATDGVYEIALKGQVGRKLRVQVDGETVGTVGEQTAGAQNFLTPVRVRLRSGKHRISIVRPGGSLRPADDAPSTLDGLVVSPAGNESQVQTIGPKNFGSLCGQLTDWIEAVRT